MTNNFDLCSFCGKSEKEVDVIIVGPDVCICDQCIGACVTQIARIAINYGELQGTSKKTNILSKREERS